MSDPNCVLCRTVADLPSSAGGHLIWEFPHSVALLGPWQYYEGYCLLVCRSHAAELSGLSEPVRRAYLDEMCLLARAIEDCFRPRKLNYELLGNQVPHLHWHLFPRSEADPEHLKPVWTAIDRAEGDENEKRRLQGSGVDRAAVIDRLRTRLRELSRPV